MFLFWRRLRINLFCVSLIVPTLVYGAQETSTGLLVPRKLTEEPMTNESKTEAETTESRWKNLSVDKTRFAAGLEYSDYTYSEPGIMNIKMHLFGVMGRMEAALQNPDYAVIGEGYLMTGHGSYDGGLTTRYDDGSLTTTPLSTNTQTTILHLRVLLGRQYLTGTSGLLLPYIGLGSHDLYNHIDGTGGYHRQITYLYLPVGIQYTYKASDSWQFGGGVEADGLIYGTVKSNLSEANSSFPDVTNYQKSGYGSRLFLNARYFVNEIGFEIRPYVSRWKIDTSDGVANSMGTYWVEPRNETYQTGVDLSVLF